MYMSGELSVCVFCILSREFLKQFFREMIVIAWRLILRRVLPWEAPNLPMLS